MSVLDKIIEVMKFSAIFFCHTGKELSFASIKGSHVSLIYQSSLKEDPVDKILGFQ